MTARHVVLGSLAAGLLLLCAVAAPAQVPRPGSEGQARPGMPPRDVRQPRAQVGSASVSGRVTSVDTGMPLRRVQVRVVGQELRGSRSTMTDAEGRFAIANLPAGRYGLSFTKGGYATTQYGQTRPNGSGKLVDLAEGQKVENLDAALIRGGVIAGRIVDDFGEPVVDARVQVMQLRWFNGRRRMANAGRGNSTNDRGEYRIWGLGPGDYFVSAMSSERDGWFADPETARLEASDPSGFAPTFYPGTTLPDEAQKVTVGAGQEVGTIDFALTTARLVRVSGRVMMSDGKPMGNAVVMMVPRSVFEGGGGMMMPAGGRTDSNGSFTIPRVAAGEYLLQARAEGERERSGERAVAPVSVGTEDVKDVLIVATRGVRVSGRVMFEGSAPPPSNDGLRVFMPALDDVFMVTGGGGAGRVTAEGTFEISGVTGRRTFGISASPPWILKTARIQGTDVLDSGYEFGKEDIGNVVLVLTDRAPGLTGTVTAGSNTPAPDYVVIAFSTDEAQWQQPSASRRAFSVGRPDQNGMYKVSGLRPGSYYVVALDEMPEDIGNPDLFKALKDRAKQVTLREGDAQRLDLALQTLPGV